MRKVIVNEWVTLDGVVQTPSYADEDVTGGFGHGGWHTRYFDDLFMNWVIENVRGAISTGAIIATYAAEPGSAV